jgi:hypothetical protein
MVVVLLSGFVRGIAGTFAIFALTRGRPEPVIRAHRFELIDGRGRPTAFWGTDPAGYVALEFFGQEQSGADAARTGKKQLEIGLEGKDGSPFLQFSGSDGQLRVLLDLDDFQRPLLMMKDENSLGLTLGSERTDTPQIRDKSERWVLNFLPNERARIGTVAEQNQAGQYARGILRGQPEKFKY